MREFSQIPSYLLSFLTHPIRDIDRVPPWSWPTLLFIQSFFAALCGVALGIISRSWLDVALALTLYPLLSVAITLVMTAFTYYYFLFFHSIYLEIRALYGVIVIAHIPYALFHIGSGIVPPLDLIGFASTCVLLMVGLSNTFHIDRRQTRNLIFLFFAIFAILWSITFFKRLPQLAL